MIQLLFTVVGAEAGVVVLLLVKTPLRRLVLLALDRLKRGRGPVAVRTVAITVAVFFLSSLHSMSKIQSRAGGEDGIVGLSPTDQVLWSRHLLETSLMGTELRVLRKGMEAVTKQTRMAEEGKDKASKELKACEQEIIQLNAKIAKLELESEARVKEVKTAQANAVALSKQTEGLLFEYDRLLEENQNLRTQLKSIDGLLSRSGSKKNT